MLPRGVTAYCYLSLGVGMLSSSFMSNVVEIVTLIRSPRSETVLARMMLLAG